MSHTGFVVTPLSPRPGPRAKKPLCLCRSSRADLNLRVYLVADPAAICRGSALSLVDIVDQSIRGGVSVVQLRDKKSSTRDMLQLAQSIRQVTRKHGVPFLINDRVDVALACQADGVHLGQDDLPAMDARKLLGSGAIIGVSAGVPAEAVSAEQDRADYLGVGAVYSTGSKVDAGTPIGLEGLNSVVQSCTLPVVAIGGITADTANACAFAGASGIAVISAILGQDDPTNAAARLSREFSAPIGA